jgi:hypothetical protein
MNNVDVPPSLNQDDLLSIYLLALKQAVEFVEAEVVHIAQRSTLSNQEEAILGLFYITHSLASSGTRLNNKFDFVTVASNTRSIFEILLDMKWLCQPNISEKEIKQFRAFATVDRFKKSMRLGVFQQVNPGIAASSFFDSVTRQQFVDSPERSVTIENTVEELWGRNNRGKLLWPEHWTGLRISERAKRLGPIYEQKYLEIYKLLCSFVHSGNASYAYLSQNSLAGVYGITLNITRLMYLESLNILNDIFRLEREIDSFEHRVQNLERLSSFLR